MAKTKKSELDQLIEASEKLLAATDKVPAEVRKTLDDLLGRMSAIETSFQSQAARMAEIEKQTISVNKAFVGFSSFMMDYLNAPKTPAQPQTKQNRSRSGDSNSRYPTEPN